MEPTKPPEYECEQFHDLVEKTKEPEIKKYVEKAYWAYRDGHLEAAVVLVWAGIEKFCSLVIDHVGRWYFEYHFDKQWPGKRDSKTNAIAFAKVSSRTRLFRSIFNEDKEDLKKKKEVSKRVKSIENFEHARNRYAHGTGNFATDSNDVLLLIKNVGFVLTSEAGDEKFENPEKMYEFLCQYPEEIKNFNRFISHFPTNTDFESITKKLCKAFLMNEFSSYKNLQRFILHAFDKLNSEERERIWRTYVAEAVPKLLEQGPDIESSIQGILLLPYPDRKEELMPRDDLLKAAFIFLESKNKQITDFLYASSPDNPPEDIVEDQIKIVNLVKQLDRKIPHSLSDEWQRVYRKCMADFLP